MVENIFEDIDFVKYSLKLKLSKKIFWFLYQITRRNINFDIDIPFFNKFRLLWDSAKLYKF